MKRGNKIFRCFWITYFLLWLLVIIGTVIKVNAKEVEPKLVYATAYCISGTMANGEETREGTCASNLPFGTVIALYQNDNGKLGDFICLVEVADRGGTDGIKSGKVVDIYKESKKKAQEFIEEVYENDSHGKVYAVIYEDAKG